MFANQFQSGHGCHSHFSDIILAATLKVRPNARELIAMDIDDSRRRTLTDFGVYQMMFNRPGIGNECTHWIYAALFEARALDRDRTLHIQQTGPHYTWGRLAGTNVQRGDIAQFHGFQNRFFICQVNGSGGYEWRTSDQVRGPNHTGMVFIPPKSGSYYQLELHLHQPDVTRMRVRGNTIYYQSFAIVLSASDLQQVKGTNAWPGDVKTDDIADMLERIDWVGMRQQYSIDLPTADTLSLRIRHGTAPSKLLAKGKTIACLCVVHASGYLRFYCPQASAARLSMDDTQLATEKANLIHAMIKSGRKGGRTDEDEFGGDNKEQRLHDHRFDWSYRPLGDYPLDAGRTRGG